MTNVNDLLRDHVTLTVECLDRIYLNGYIPTMQMPGQLVNFLVAIAGTGFLRPRCWAGSPTTSRPRSSPLPSKADSDRAF